MEQTDQTNQPQEHKSFEELISSYEFQMPQVGQVIQGVLIRIDSEGALVDIGVKRDAIVPARDLQMLDKEVLEKLHAGDTVVAYVTNLPKLPKGPDGRVQHIWNTGRLCLFFPDDRNTGGGTTAAAIVALVAVWIFGY